MTKTVDIWTDGGVAAIPGRGRLGRRCWRYGERRKRLGRRSGNDENRMELMAAIVAVETLKRSSKVAAHR